jgi:hypothetical protein
MPETYRIGNVVFDNDLAGLGPDPVILGSDTRTMSGDYVSLIPAEVDDSEKTVKYKFGWETFETVETLKTYWKSGLSFVADLDGTGNYVTARFSRVDGLSGLKHEAWNDDLNPKYVQGHETDLWFGIMSLIVEGSAPSIPPVIIPPSDANPYIAGSALGGHRVVIIGDDRNLYYADNTNLTHMFRVLGITTGAVNQGSVVSVQTEGPISEVSWNWTMNIPIYLTTNGQLTQSAPDIGFLLEIAFPMSPDSMFIKIDDPILL